MKARLASLILLLLLAAKLNAGIMNGDFSIDGVSPDPFANWTTDVSFFEPPSGTGFAQFDTDDINFQSIHLRKLFHWTPGQRRSRSSSRSLLQFQPAGFLIAFK